MHELSIASYLLEEVEEQARQHGAGQVLAINLVVGERAGIVDDALQFSFDLLAPGTLAAGAQINIRRTLMRFHCDDCQADYSPSGGDFGCRRCGTVGRIVDDGSDLAIESMEIAT